MHRFRWILVTLVLASMMFVMGPSSATAQVATPIAIPTVTAAGCDQIPAYAGERQKIMDELIDGIAAIFPTVATPITEHGAQLAAEMMVMTPAQYGEMSTLYDETASKISALEAPEIASFYNAQVAELYRLAARTFAEAQTSDLTTAGTMYGAQLDAVATAFKTYGASAATVCPAFAEVLTIESTKIGV